MKEKLKSGKLNRHTHVNMPFLYSNVNFKTFVCFGIVFKV